MIKRIQNILKYLSESSTLNEDFYKGVSIESERLKRNEYTEIFKNPSYSELRTLWMEGRDGKYDYFRFILNNTGLFVWNWDILHYEIEGDVPELYQSRGGYYGILRVVPTGGISIKLDIGREGFDNDRKEDWKSIDRFVKEFKSMKEIKNLKDNLGREPSVSAEEVL